MKCPDCNTEMNHMAGYSKNRDDIRYEEYCPRLNCGAKFEGLLKRIRINERNRKSRREN